MLAAEVKALSVTDDHVLKQMFASAWRAGGIPLCLFYHPTATSFLDGRPQITIDLLSKAKTAQAFLREDRGETEVDKAVVICCRQREKMLLLKKKKSAFEW